MPRPAKGKRGKGTAAVGVNDAADLLERLNSSGLGEKEVLGIVGADKAPCEHLRSPCTRNRKDNVACFCQLVPAETSYRKKGLWQKEQMYLGTLGLDPKEKQREDAATPAGLRNLGNTCYANAALQCLFSIPSLRTGIYTAEPTVAGHDILRQLQGLFLQMQFGPRRSVDTEALAKTLGLNHAIQQDGQEFLKLLLTRVEQLLNKSSDEAARRLVPQLFRGGLSYVTTCQRCGRDSSSSREVQDFYDLMPQVRGFSSLTSSLASLLHAESLSGDNRYLCDFCGVKVDAKRRVRLRAMPPYTCLALQRFYFDPRTFDKAKALDKFAFPLTLDFSQVLAEAAAAEQASAAEAAAATAQAAAAADAAAADGAAAAAGGAAAPKAADAAAATAAAVALETPSYPVEGSPLYELVGILIHKGSQAHSGHYVAHIKDQASGLWWRFDDEVAACIGPDPAAAFQSDHGAVGAAAAAAAAAGAGAAADGSSKGAGSSRKRAAGDEDMDYEEEAAAAGEEPGNGGGEEDDDAEDAGAGGKRGARGGRGGKKRARAGSRAGRGAGGGGGRGGKKGGAAAAGGFSAESGAGSKGKGGQGRRGGRRGRASAAADVEGDVDGDASDADGELRAALAASMAQQQQEDEGLRLAVEASMAHVAGGSGGGGGGGGSAAAAAEVAGEAGGAHAGDAEEEALVQMALEESAREAEMAAVMAGAGGRAEGGDAAGSVEDGFGQQGDARSPMESDAEAVAAAMAASLVDAAAPTPPRLTPPPSLSNAPLPRPSHLRPLAVKAEATGEDLKGSVHNSPKAGAAAAAAAVKDEGRGKAGGVGGSGSLVSSNAYMLVYRAVGLQEPPPALDVQELPPALQAAVAEAAAAYADECDVYQRQRDALKAQVEERRRSVREILSFISPRLPLGTASQQQQQQSPEAPMDITEDDEDSAAASAPQQQQQQQQQQALGTAGYWVSMPWLELWANEEGAPPPIDNGPITCAIHSRAGAGGAAAGAAGGPEVHGGGGSGGGGSCLDPAKIAVAKLVSPEAWERLYAAHRGGPVLAAGDVCRQCLEGSASQALLGNQAEEVRRRVAALLEAGAAGGAEAELEEAEVEDAMDAEEGAAPRSFWVSRLWLQGWSKRQGASVKAEKSPTADLACPHGQLLPARTAKRVAVPADIWRFLRDLWRRQRVAEAQDAAAGKPAPAGRGRGRKAAGAAGAGAEGSADAEGTNGSAGAGARAGVGAGSSSPSAAVDCLDLTADDAPGPAARGKAGKHEAVEIDQDDGDDDDGVQLVEAPQQAGGEALGAAAAAEGQEDGSAGRRSREASAVPPSREGTADVEAPVPPSELGAAADAAAADAAAATAAAAKPPHIPTAAELEAMCPELPVLRVFECELCREAAGQAASAHADTRRQMDMERNALSGLKLEAWPQLMPGCRYYMVPTSWVREWQQYVRVMPKGTPAAPRPGSLSGAMQRVLCACHPDEPRLSVPPPRLAVSKRSRLAQLDLEQDPMRLISQEDWDCLRRLYLRDLTANAATAGGGAAAAAAAGGVRDAGAAKRRASRRASAAITNGAHDGVDDSAGGDREVQPQEQSGVDVVVVDGADGSDGAAANAARLTAIAHGFTADIAQLGEEAQDTGAAGAPVSAGGRIGGGCSRRRGADADAGAAVVAPSVSVWPPVCWEALAAQGRAALEAALVYSEAEVMVELVAAEDLEAAFKDSGAGLERRSRRTRKGRTAITVSNTTTLEQLKLQIFESLSIHPKNQLLYVRGDDGSPRQLQGDELSLAQHEVLPGAELRLVRLRLVDDDDDVAGLFGEGRAKRRQVEEGFKNTALHGDLPPQLQEKQEKQQAAAGAEQGGAAGGSGSAAAQVAVEEDPHVL